MDKVKALKWINTLLALSFFIQVSSSLMMKFAAMNFIFEIHASNGWILILLVALHLLYNWSWVKANILCHCKKNNT